MRIKPVYRRGHFLGFAIYVRGEAVGAVYSQYKHAALLLRELQS